MPSIIFQEVQKIQKNIIFSLCVVTFLSFAMRAQAMEEVVAPLSSTHIDVRCRVFECYYLKNPLNEDKSIFNHMRKWHNEDIQCIDDALKDSKNKIRLKSIHEILDQSFTKKTVTFPKIAAAYLAYSMLITLETEPEENTQDDVKVTATFVMQYIKTGVCQIPAQSNGEYGSSGEYWLSRLIELEKHKLRFLPYIQTASPLMIRNLSASQAPMLWLYLRSITCNRHTYSPFHLFCNALMPSVVMHLGID